MTGRRVRRAVRRTSRLGGRFGLHVRGRDGPDQCAICRGIRVRCSAAGHWPLCGPIIGMRPPMMHGLTWHQPTLSTRPMRTPTPMGQWHRGQMDSPRAFIVRLASSVMTPPRGAHVSRWRVSPSLASEGRLRCLDLSPRRCLPPVCVMTEPPLFCSCLFPPPSP